MDMSIRELDFCMFGTFLELMTHFNNLAQGDVQYIQMPYSTLSEVDDMASKKHKIHVPPLLCSNPSEQRPDRGTHSLIPSSPIKTLGGTPPNDEQLAVCLGLLLQLRVVI